MKAFLSLNRDKYFALYWCFCVRISFILLLIKWSEMDPNVKPQTLVETFDQANSNSIRTICSSNNFGYPVSTCTALDCKLLYEGPWQTRDWALLQFCTYTSTTENVIDIIDGIITEFARLKGRHTHLALCLKSPWWRHSILPFFCRKHCTSLITLERGKTKQLITVFSFVFI